MASAEARNLRHTFGSLLIQDGASLAYVKNQMGHSSIQITVDTYGHLIPGADIACVDRLDSKTSPQQSATETQQATSESEQDSVQVTEKIWLPPRDSNPDMLIQSQVNGCTPRSLIFLDCSVISFLFMRIGAPSKVSC